jgi:Na+/proline symporter
MDKSILSLTADLTPALGFATMIGLGLFLLVLSFAIKTALVRNTHDFIIADRKVGFGFGVGSVIAVWTWAMAVMMSSAMTFRWGLSGLFWFVVPNGFAVIAMVPFARILRRNMPQGYTISEFVQRRFRRSRVASGIVTVTMIFGILLEILINLKGTSVVISTVFSIDWKVAAVVGIACVLTYSYFGGLWTSVMTGTLNTLMVTVPAAIVVAAVYEQVPGGAAAVFAAADAADARNLSVLRPDAAAGFGVTLAFGLLAATVADQTFWQKVWAIKGREVARTFFWAGALFYPIPICLGMLGLVGIAFGCSTADIGGDLAAVGPYIVSHIGCRCSWSSSTSWPFLPRAIRRSTVPVPRFPRSSRSMSSSATGPRPERARSSSSRNCRCCLEALRRRQSCCPASTSPRWCLLPTRSRRRSCCRWCSRSCGRARTPLASSAGWCSRS